MITMITSGFAGLRGFCSPRLHCCAASDAGPKFAHYQRISGAKDREVRTHRIAEFASEIRTARPTRPLGRIDSTTRRYNDEVRARAVRERAATNAVSRGGYRRRAALGLSTAITIAANGLARGVMELEPILDAAPACSARNQAKPKT